MRQILFIITIGFFFAASALAGPVSAQTFKFSLVNPTQPVCVGNNFQVQILINTSGQQTINGDALFSFDPALVTINSAQSGNFYTYFSALPLGGVDNKYLVSSWEESIAHAKSSSTDTLFATMNLSAKAIGAVVMSFDCTANTDSDSNISRASDSKDIIICPLQSLNLTVQVAGICTGVSGTPVPTSPPVINTPTPTRTPTSTPIPIPTSTPVPASIPSPPVPGNMQIVFVGMGLGTLLTIAGLLFIL